MDAIVNGLVLIIEWCNKISHNYWVAIFLFTLITKIILFPLSLMVQKNSVKIVRITPELNMVKAQYLGNNDAISEEQYKLYKREKYSPFMDLVPLVIQLALLMLVVDAIKIGTPLTDVPIKVGGATFIVPVLAAFSAFIMCFIQNKVNVLQAEQNAWNQYGTMALSIGLSLYLGIFVAVGVGSYWIFSNLLSTAQLFLLNVIINPKKYIDYEALEESKIKLKEAKDYMQAGKKKSRKDPYKAKETADYKRFLKFPGSKKIVFYSEKNGFYKYYKNIIEDIIDRTNIVIHYITSDAEDEVFKMESDQFIPYYIGENKLIVLMMKMECKLFVMTTPDLQNFQLKRSYVDKNIEYIYVPHDVNSSNLTFHKNALDHFDTIFTSGLKNKEEIKEREDKYCLPKKNLVEWGSSVVDNMSQSYAEMISEADILTHDKKTILIAPSWQKDNILDSCIDSVLDNVDTGKYNVIVRPHPQYVRHFESKINDLAEKYSEKGIVFQKDFSSNKTVYTADALITDWSSIAYEYTFSTLKPVLFINTPMKVVNPDYKELSTVPIDIELRSEVGISLELDSANKVSEEIDKLFSEKRFTRESLAGLRDKYIYNVGKSGSVGADYMIQRLIELQNM